MRKNDMWTRVALGAAAGLVGTMAIQALLKTHQKVSPGTMPPIEREPGEFMLNRVKHALPQKLQEHVPMKAEVVGGKLLGLGYGMTFGAIYAAARPKTQRAFLEGALFGLAAWASGYLGWLPGAKLMRPVWKHRPVQMILPVAEHALYGMATVTSYRWLKSQVKSL
jgi:hypothetical protein